MADGDSSLISPLSYVAVGRETTFGTYTTATNGINFISSSIKTLKESKVLEQIETNRAFSKRIGLGRVIEGDLEFYADPKNTGFGFILQNAMGGAITSATATGETTGGAAFTHTFGIGQLDEQTNKSLCINLRKGESAGGMVFEYSGLRVNELGLNAEIDEALKCTISMMGKDSTQTSNDVSSAITGTQSKCLSFTRGRISVENTFASLTSTSFWHVQSVEFGVTNSLKSDTDSRRIGSDVIDVLPQGIAAFTLNVSMRFDTLTAYNAMLNESTLSAQFFFDGDTLATSTIRESLQIDMPRVFVNNAGDPEIGGPDEIIRAEVEFMILRDVSSASGFAVQALLTNATSTI